MVASLLTQVVRPVQLGLQQKLLAQAQIELLLTRLSPNAQYSPSRLGLLYPATGLKLQAFFNAPPMQVPAVAPTYSGRSVVCYPLFVFRTVLPLGLFADTTPRTRPATLNR